MRANDLHHENVIRRAREDIKTIKQLPLEACVPAVEFVNYKPQPNIFTAQTPPDTEFGILCSAAYQPNYTIPGQPAMYIGYNCGPRIELRSVVSAPMIIANPYTKRLPECEYYVDHAKWSYPSCAMPSHCGDVFQSKVATGWFGDTTYCYGIQSRASKTVLKQNNLVIIYALEIYQDDYMIEEKYSLMFDGDEYSIVPNDALKSFMWYNLDTWTYSGNIVMHKCVRRHTDESLQLFSQIPVGQYLIDTETGFDNVAWKIPHLYWPDNPYGICIKPQMTLPFQCNDKKYTNVFNIPTFSPVIELPDCTSRPIPMYYDIPFFTSLSNIALITASTCIRFIIDEILKLIVKLFGWLLLVFTPPAIILFVLIWIKTNNLWLALTIALFMSIVGRI